MRQIALGDNYNVKWHLLLKLIVMWYVKIKNLQFFYYCFCLKELHQKQHVTAFTLR